ncbi:MAG: type II secretion system protein GspL [Psychromonas sp.]|nr:type II secretion system protein GspL [Psychromonas sp.]
MTERLIIRLASKASQKNHWLIWSDSEHEIIASGDVNNAEQLTLLTEKSQQRVVICLLPGVDVCIRKITVNGVSNRQLQQALPYLIEDELASDVDTVHFSVIAKQANLLHVAICDKQKIAMWLDWLKAAQIRCRQFIPEGLALPVSAEGKWQAVQLDKQWIIRENQNMAWSCDAEMLDLILDCKCEDDSPPQIESYTSSAENKVAEWVALSPMLPMEVLAKNTQNNKINLLSGEFKPRKETSKQFERWRAPAIVSILLFVTFMLNLYLQNVQVQKQTQLVKQHVESVYQQAFPALSRLKYARIKKKIKSMLEGIGDNVDSGFLLMLNELVPAFADNPEFKVSAIKFDSKKQEMRIAASTDNFQSFEKFNAALPKHFNVEQGALNSSQEGVSGLLTIRMK